MFVLRSHIRASILARRAASRTRCGRAVALAALRAVLPRLCCSYPVKRRFFGGPQRMRSFAMIRARCSGVMPGSVAMEPLSICHCQAANTGSEGSDRAKAEPSGTWRLVSGLCMGRVLCIAGGSAMGSARVGKDSLI